MAESGDITERVATVAVILILVATLGVSAFNTLGNSTMITNYSETLVNSTAPNTVYLSQIDLKDGSLAIFNSTYVAVVTTDYTVVYSTGVVTIPVSTGLQNGTDYSMTYQKDNVPSTVKTLVITVLGIIAAIAIIVILLRVVK